MNYELTITEAEPDMTASTWKWVLRYEGVRIGGGHTATKWGARWEAKRVARRHKEQHERVVPIVEKQTLNV